MFNKVLDTLKNFDPFGWKKTKRESVFLTSNFDAQAFQEARESIPPLQEAWQKYDEGGQWEQGNPTQDLFYAMLKKSPVFDDDAKPGLSPLKSIIEQTMKLPEFDKLKKRSVGNPLCAGVGAAGLVDKAMELVPDEAQQAAKEAEQAQAKADEAEQREKQAQAMIDMLTEQFELPTDVGELNELGGKLEHKGDAAQQGKIDAIDETLTAYDDLAQAQADGAKAQAAVAQAVQAFDEAMADSQAEFQAGLNQAIAETSKEAQDKAEFITQFGLAAGYDPQDIDLEVIKAALAVYSNKTFDDFADMIGYATSVSSSVLRQTLHGRNDKVKTRNASLNPARMTQPEKLASWGVKGQAVKADWQNRAVSGRVRHNEYDKGRKEAEASKGDIVVIRDDSGSTSGSIHSLLVSVEWQLLKHCKTEDRKFTAIPFSGSGQFHEWTPPAMGEKNVQALTDHFQLHYAGGTEPFKPILHGFDVIERNSLKADMVIMTDAQFGRPSPEFLARLADLQAVVDIRIYAVVVGPMSDDYKIDWANETINIRNLADKNKIKSIFERTL